MSPTMEETDFMPIQTDISAPLKLIQLANEHLGELEVIAIGPLTNLAAAVKLDHQLPGKFRSLTIMGGNMNGIGNMHVVGEFNFYADPEGAKIVLGEYTPLCKTTIVSWEACCLNQFSPDSFDTEGLSDLGDFLNMIKGGHVDGSADFSKMSSAFSNQGEVMCDLLAAVVALHPELVVQSEHYPVSVELQGQYTRSMMVV